MSFYVRLSITSPLTFRNRNFLIRVRILRDTDDSLPAKFFKPLTGTGPSRGVALDREVIEGALDEYYRLAGWDAATGNPTPDTLQRLGLAWVS